MGCRPTSNFLVPHTILPHGPTQLLIMPSVFLLSLLGSRLRRPCNHVSSCSHSPWSGLGVGVSLGENTCAPVVFNSYCNKLNKQVFKETEAEMILLGFCSVWSHDTASPLCSLDNSVSQVAQQAAKYMRLTDPFWAQMGANKFISTYCQITIVQYNWRWYI